MSDKKKNIKKKKSSFFSDFKAFINKGNVVDLAVGVVIGGAFGKIVTSLVNDIIMPLIMLALGRTSLSNLSFQIAEGSALAYGLFIQSVIDFLIITLSIFIMIRLLTHAQTGMKELQTKLFEHQPAPLPVEAVEAVETVAVPPVEIVEPVAVPPAETVQVSPALEQLLTEIRDLLKKQGDN